MLRLDDALVERGANLFSGEEPEAGMPIREMTVADAVYLVEMHRRRRDGDPRAPGRWRRPRTLAEVKGGILKTLSSLARRRGYL